MEFLGPQALIDAAYALGIGLVVGLEREHSGVAADLGAGEVPARHGAEAGEAATIMGVRTFALLSLVGWAVGFVGATWTWVPPVSLLVIGGLVIAQYLVHREVDAGLTTEVAAVTVFVLGILVNLDRALAAALALATTVLLISKPWVRRVVVKVRRVELSGTLQLLILLAIVLPLLPEEPRDPWNALPPRKIGYFVVLIAGLSYIGYVLTRILGERKSAGLTGLFGGITSSTATTVAMAKAGREETMRMPGQLAVFLANAVMFFRVLVITAVLSTAVAVELLVPVGAMGAVMLAGAAWRWRTLGAPQEKASAETPEPELRNPFALLPALKWGAVLCAVLLFAHFAQQYAGDRGLFAAAAASGLADVDAITLAVTRQAADAEIPIGTATTAITIAVISNTVVKGGMAYFGGGKRFGVPIAAFFLATIAVGGLVILLV